MLMLCYIWYCGSANHLVVLNTARTRGHAKPENFCELFKIKFEKIFLYKQLARVVQMWNKPPNEVVQAPTISVFWQSWPRQPYWFEIGYANFYVIL